MAEENQNVCYFNKYGFCKFKLTCRKKHNMEICSKKSCEIRLCSLRHPKSCRYYREIGFCKFGEWCLFRHEDFNRKEMVEAVEKMDAKIEGFENSIHFFQKSVSEKDVEIAKLEERIKMGEEKIKVLEEKINNLLRDDISNEFSNKLRDIEEKQTNLIEEYKGKHKCSKCDFTTYYKKGLTIHKTKMHKVFTCTKCGEIFDTGREYKVHVYTHSYTSEAMIFKCKNCEFETKSVYTMEVHVAKCNVEKFECGLCEDTFVEEKDLDTHLRTCEIYECSDCWKRLKNLSDIKKHIEENHKDYTTLNHLKINREREFEVKAKEYTLQEV